MEEFLRDVQYAVRTLRRSPGLTAVMIVSLAIGIGANTPVTILSPRSRSGSRRGWPEPLALRLMARPMPEDRSTSAGRLGNRAFQRASTPSGSGPEGLFRYARKLHR